MSALNVFLSSPMLGICLSIFAYKLGHYVSGRTKVSWLNPVLIAFIFCIVFLKVFNIPYADFATGGDIIAIFLGPVTVVLAIPIYSNLRLLKENLLPILAGAVAGSATALGSVFALCKLYGFDAQLTATMLPKSVTSPIAIEISEALGGLPSVTLAAVLVSGLTGALFSPLMLKLIRAKNPIAAGVAIGTCSHAFGTSKALEIGETQGAMAGLSLSIAGVATVLLSLLFR